MNRLVEGCGVPSGLEQRRDELLRDDVLVLVDRAIFPGVDDRPVLLWVLFVRARQHEWRKAVLPAPSRCRSSGSFGTPSRTHVAP